MNRKETNDLINRFLQENKKDIKSDYYNSLENLNYVLELIESLEYYSTCISKKYLSNYQSYIEFSKLNEQICFLGIGKTKIESMYKSIQNFLRVHFKID